MFYLIRKLEQKDFPCYELLLILAYLPGGLFIKDLELMKKMELIEVSITELRQSLKENQDDGLRRSSLQGSNQSGGFYYFFERTKDIYRLKPRIQGK